VNANARFHNFSGISGDIGKYIGHGSFVRFVGVRVGVATWVNELALLNLNLLGGQTDMARSTRLLNLIKNINTVYGRKRFLLSVTYFSTNLVYSTSNGCFFVIGLP